MSRSKLSLSRRSHSGTSGTDTDRSSPSSSPIPREPNRSNCPAASLRFTETAASIASSCMSARERRVCPRSSNAPALISESMVRLLHTLNGTFCRKSLNDSYRPFSLRAVIIPSTTFAPTLRTAPMPKRISSPTGANVSSDSFTSGGSTVMPMRWHSFRYMASLSLLSPTLVSSAAMYSCG